MQRPMSSSIVLMSALVSLSLLGCGGSPADEVAGTPQGESAAPVEPTPAVGESQAGLSCSTSTAQVPTMTSATTPSGVVSRSGAFDSTYEAWRAFDGSDSSMWISATFQTPAWIGYQWASGSRTVTSYAITFVNGSLTTRAPKDWTLQGWNGGSWVVVDTRSNQTSWLGVETRTYPVASPGSYSAYRLNVTDDNDSRTGVVVVSMGRLQFFGPSCQ